jgi:hypothetical protein
MRIRRNKTILEQAADYAASALDTAVEKAGPILADAKEQAGPRLSDARDKAGPVLAQGAALAATKASEVADLASAKAAEGKELAATKAAELSGEPKKKHRVRTLLILTGIAAVLGFVAKKLTSRGDQDDWQSSYTPPPARTVTPIADAAATASAGGAADEGGAGPDEALADSVEEEHEVTTPDEPAEVVDLAPGEEPAEKKSAKP